MKKGEGRMQKAEMGEFRKVEALPAGRHSQVIGDTRRSTIRHFARDAI